MSTAPIQIRAPSVYIDIFEKYVLKSVSKVKPRHLPEFSFELTDCHKHAPQRKENGWMDRIHSRLIVYFDPLVYHAKRAIARGHDPKQRKLSHPTIETVLHELEEDLRNGTKHDYHVGAILKHELMHYQFGNITPFYKLLDETNANQPLARGIEMAIDAAVSRFRESGLEFYDPSYTMDDVFYYVKRLYEYASQILQNSFGHESAHRFTLLTKLGGLDENLSRAMSDQPYDLVETVQDYCTPLNNALLDMGDGNRHVAYLSERLGSSRARAVQLLARKPAWQQVLDNYESHLEKMHRKYPPIPTAENLRVLAGVTS